MRIFVIMLIVGVLMSACTSTRFVRQRATISRNDTLTYGEAHEELQSSFARVYLTDNQEILGTVHQITNDTVFVSDASTDYIHAIPGTAVQRIEHIDRAGGYFVGYYSGLMGGLLAVLGLAALNYLDFEQAGFEVYLIAAAGATAGAVYGLSHGIVHVYQFQDASVVHTSSDKDTLDTP